MKAADERTAKKRAKRLKKKQKAKQQKKNPKSQPQSDTGKSLNFIIYISYECSLMEAQANIHYYRNLNDFQNLKKTTTRN